MDESMIQIDLWGGECSMSLVKTHTVNTWSEAHKITEEAAEGGFLVNIIMIDFIAGLSGQEIIDRTESMKA
jgi:hypothetical protein